MAAAMTRMLMQKFSSTVAACAEKRVSDHSCRPRSGRCCSSLILRRVSLHFPSVNHLVRRLTVSTVSSTHEQPRALLAAPSARSLR